VILARIQPLLDRTRRPQQSGFTRGRSTIDAILAVRLLSEIHCEFSRSLNVAYLDIKTAFDSVDCRALWKALRSRGIPDVLTDLIAALHENTGAAIRARLETTSGVRQGCILASALFCVAIDWILNHITMRPSINIGNSSFNDLVYANDTAFFTKDATDATDCLSSFSHSSSVFGLHTSWPKTKLQSVSSGSGPDLLNVVVDGNPVDLMESFTYLGSIQTSDGYCRSDITRRIGVVSSAMSSLSNIWNTKHLSIQTKVRVYQTLVLSILLYASETWTSLASDMRAIESFHTKCQRRILGIRWHDLVRNSEVSLRTGLTPVSDRIIRGRNAKTASQHSSTPGHAMPSRAIGWSTPDPTWKRPPGRPRTKWTDQLCRDNYNVLIATLWRQAIGRGHSRATLRSEPTMR